MGEIRPSSGDGHSRHGGRPDRVDLSLVICIFREGRLIHPTLRSLSAAIGEVLASGWSAEVVLVLDRTDASTLNYLDENIGELFPGAQVNQLYVNNGDLGLSRNSGLGYSRGRFVAFSDDDNLYSSNWLSACLARLAASQAEEILHPAFMINFEHRDVLWQTLDSDDPALDLRFAVEHNPWDATCVAPRDVFERIPYAASLAGPGFGPEDWQWNCETLDAGWVHRAVPETVMFYRVKSSGSLLALLDGNGALLAPTRYLSRNRWVGRAPLTAVKPGPSEEAPTAVPMTSKPWDSVRRTVLAASRSTAKRGARWLRWLAKVHPRMSKFARYVRPGVADLLAPPQRTPLVVDARPVASVIAEFPPWLLHAWRGAHDLEPALFPAQGTMDAMTRWRPSPTAYTDVYWELVDELAEDGRGPDYLVLIPWFASGGASSVVLNYVRAVRELNPLARVIVLSTARGDSGKGALSDPLVRFVAVPDAFHELTIAEQDRLLGTLIIQIPPRAVHLVNSAVGYRAFAKYARQLAVQSKLFVSAFTLDESPEGQRSHPLLDAIRSYFDQLSGVFVDNQALADFLASTYALPRSRFFVHYQPVSETASPRTGVPPASGATERLSVLWAARLDRQKRPDILVSVSRRCRELGLPIDFHASGGAVLDDDPTLIDRLQDAGVSYLGPYLGSIGSLGRSFDVLLLTSQWEGLPLTLLDGARNDLTIVAPDVGGVADFVRDGWSGYLIPSYSDIEAYVATLTRLHENRELLVATRPGALELAQGRHSWQQFTTRVRESAGYVG